MGPLLFGLLIGLLVLIGFLGLWRVQRARDPVDARLREYGADAVQATDGRADAAADKRQAWPTVTKLLAGFGLGPRLAMALTRADLPMTAAEYALITLGAAVAGLLLGMLRNSLLLGLLLAAVGGYLPVFYLGFRAGRRRRAFTAQLPDLLTMLVGALRAGYGLTQALELLARQVGEPASKELDIVVRSVGLGLPVQEALRDMSERVDSDDLDLVVTAVSVQYEMGGNLSQTLETIGETVRERIRILQEIRVMTAQQRFTGYFLAVWPPLIGVVLYLINPTYIGQLFAPGWIRLLPVAAVVMQIAGFLVIRRIVDIEV